MKRAIRINCYEAYKIAIEYEKEATVLESSCIALQSNKEGVITAWQDASGSEIYNEKIEAYVLKLENVIKFLREKAEILKKMAIAHNGNDNTFAENIKRSNVDGRYNSK